MFEYLGEMIKRSTYFKRYCINNNAKKSLNYYGIELPNGYILDSTKKGNFARFLNHSCQPNTELQIW